MADTLAEPMLSVINKSFEERIYPNHLKDSRVFPIYKAKGEKYKAENYRPIPIVSD